MTSAELFIHYHQHPLPIRKPPEPEVTTPMVAVMAYHKWIMNKCKSCGTHGCSGLWLATFSDDSQYHLLLCAYCGMNSRHISKACGVTGFGAPAFIALDLVITLTYQSTSS